LCPILKKLTKLLQPYREVTRLIDDISKSKKANNCRVLEHLLSFAEHQFGNEVTGKRYREREDGERISNWKEDIEILHSIIRTLANYYRNDCSLSTVIRDDMRFPYLERSLSLLNPWELNLDLDASNRIDSLNKD
jgi:hypothetical protein